MTWSIAASMVSQGAPSTAGSRLPCTVTSASMRSRATSSGTRQSTPTQSTSRSIAPYSSPAPTPKCTSGTRRPLASTRPRTASSAMRDAGATCSRYCSSGSEPAHESKSWAADGALLDLRAQEAAGHVGGPARQPVPRIRERAHERARLEVVLRGATRDEVRGERERGAGEADQRRRAVADLGEARDRLAHALAHRLERGVEPCGVERHDAVDVLGSADGVGHHRPDARLDLHVDAREPQRHHDVAEEDGGVDAVPAHGLQRDLARELRLEARVEHVAVGAVGAAAQLAVLGQRATGLAHEPDGRHVGAVAAVRPHQSGLAGAGVQRVVFAKGRHPLHHPTSRRAIGGASAQDRRRTPQRTPRRRLRRERTAPASRPCGAEGRASCGRGRRARGVHGRMLECSSA